MAHNIFDQRFCQIFQAVTVNGLYPGHPFDDGNTRRPARSANCRDHFNRMLIGLKKVSALAGDNFQGVIICEGILIDRYRLIGGIISL